MIQRNYRAYRRFRILPKLLRKRKEDATILVQKFIKGYAMRKKVMNAIVTKKIDANYVYFEELRSKLEVYAYNIISLHWLRYLGRKIDTMD